METINKLLVICVISAIIAICFVVHKFLDYTNNNITVPYHNIVYTHPYNDCIKLLIDQANKENIKFDQEQSKSVCFELLNHIKDVDSSLLKNTH